MNWWVRLTVKLKDRSKEWFGVGMSMMKKRLIVALDVDSLERARDLVVELKPHVGLFKVGMELFNSSGPDAVKLIRGLGAEVFIDLKELPNEATPKNDPFVIE